METLRVVWKYARSFLKRDWSADDYPVRVREQPAHAPHEDVPRYAAQIINWWALTGLGETPEEALEDLARKLEEFKRRHGYLHRPGREVPITYAATDGIDAHAATAQRFLVEVLGFRPDSSVFISDQSSLYDFEGRCGGADLVEKTRNVFGVDVSDIEDGNLLRIFERIDHNA